MAEKKKTTKKPALDNSLQKEILLYIMVYNNM